MLIYVAANDAQRKVTPVLHTLRLTDTWGTIHSKNPLLYTPANKTLDSYDLSRTLRLGIFHLLQNLQYEIMTRLPDNHKSVG